MVRTEEIKSVDAQFTFFPNPVRDMGSIGVFLTKAENVKFELYNIFGKQLISGEQQFLKGGKHTIPMSVAHLANGIYFIKLITGNKKEETIRFVVDR